MEKTAKAMLDAMRGTLAKNWPKIRECTEQALNDEREVLQDIANARIKGDIDDAEMRSQLDDEKDTLAAVLLVCQIKAKKAAETAANAAIKVLEDAIRVALAGI